MIVVDPDNKEITALQRLPALFKLKHAAVPNADTHFIVVLEVGAYLTELAVPIP